jgi:nucleotide-binding universal stress UspA family protein
MTTMLTTTDRQVRARPHGGGRVVVGVDDSPGGLAALRWAVRFARSREAQLVAVRVWGLGLPSHGGRRRRGNGHGHIVLAFEGSEHREAAAQLTRRTFGAVGGVPCDLDVTIETPEGSPGPVLTEIASGAGDVLVVGTTHGPRPVRAVHGSVSAYCARHSRCLVTVVGTGHRNHGQA